MQITESIIVDAPIDRVWELTIDLEALPSVTPTVTRVERLDDGPVQVGTQARLSQPRLPRLVWTVETLDAPNRFTWATRLFGVRMVGVHELASVGANQTHLTLGVAFEGRGAAGMARLTGRSIARALEMEAEGFALAGSAAPA